MGYLFLLGLGLADFGFSTERLLDARRLGFEREGPFVERQLFAGEVILTPTSSPISPDSSFWEAPWLPPRRLSYESGGTRDAQSRTSYLLESREAAEKSEGVWLPTPSKGELFHCREAAIPSGPASRFTWSPWDRIVVLDASHVAWNEGISGITLLTELERCLEPLGMPSENGVSLGVSLDMLGFEEFEGAHLSPFEVRHGTPGIRNLSTGLGVTIRF